MKDKTPNALCGTGRNLARFFCPRFQSQYCIAKRQYSFSRWKSFHPSLYGTLDNVWNEVMIQSCGSKLIPCLSGCSTPWMARGDRWPKKIASNVHQVLTLTRFCLGSDVSFISVRIRRFIQWWVSNEKHCNVTQFHLRFSALCFNQ